MAINLYGPGLALSQVTDFSLLVSIGVCGLVCTFYTTIVSSYKSFSFDYKESSIYIRVE